MVGQHMLVIRRCSAVEVNGVCQKGCGAQPREPELGIRPRRDQRTTHALSDDGLSQDTGIRSGLDAGPEVWPQSSFYTWT